MTDHKGQVVNDNDSRTVSTRTFILTINISAARNTRLISVFPGARLT